MDKDGAIKIAGYGFVIGILVVMMFLVVQDTEVVCAQGSGSGSGACCAAGTGLNAKQFGNNCYNNDPTPPCAGRVGQCMGNCRNEGDENDWSGADLKCCYNGILDAKLKTNCGCKATDPKDGGFNIGAECRKWEMANCGKTREQAEATCKAKCEGEFAEMCEIGNDNYDSNYCKNGVVRG